MSNPEQLSNAGSEITPSSGTLQTLRGADLQPLTVSLLEAHTPEQVLEMVVSRGIRVLGAPAGLVALLTPDGRYLDIVQSQGYPQEVIETWQRMSVDMETPISTVARERKPMFFQGRADWERLFPDILKRPTHPARASACLPLVAGQRTLGVIHFSFGDERHPYQDSEKEFLFELARQCALAFDRAQAHRRLEEAQARLELISRIGEAMTESLDVTEGLERLVDLCVPALGDWISVFIAEEGEAIPRCVVSRHRNPSLEVALREVHQTYPPRTDRYDPRMTALSTGCRELLRPITEELESQQNLEPRHAELVRLLAMGEYLCEPLTARGRTFGVVTLCLDRRNGRTYDPDLLTTVEIMARRAAFSIDNAMLYATAQREISERVRLERERVEQSRRLAIALDSTRTGAWELDLVSRRGWLSELACEIFGIPFRDWFDITSEWAGIVHPDDRDRVLARVREFQRAGDHCEVEFRIRRADTQDERWVSAKGAFVQDESGKAVRAVGVLRDITEEKRAQFAHETALRQRQDAVEENARLLRASAETAEQQRRFLRDVLASVTEGRLILCEATGELPQPLPEISGDVVALSRTNLKPARDLAEAMARRCGMSDDRISDLLTGISEASMNAVVHAGGGTAEILADTERGLIQVWIRDRGRGIDLSILPRATLERGYSSGGSFGHGFFHMLKACDRIYLLTGVLGTTVVLEQSCESPQPSWL